MKNIEAAKIAKKITKKAYAPAYITPDNNIIGFNEDRSVLFTAEIEAAITDAGKTYTLEALDYIAKSGTITGGAVCEDPAFYNIPEDVYTPVCTLDYNELKYTANYSSKDNARPVLTGLHIGGGYIEACDGFRATRHKIEGLREDVNINIPAAVLAYGGLKKAVKIEAGAKYARITCENTGAVFYTRLLEGNYINLDSIYTSNAAKNTITFNPAEITAFVDSMRRVKDKHYNYRITPLLIKIEGNRMGLAFDGEAVNGYKSFDITNGNPDAVLVIALNPEYVYTALKGGANSITYNAKNNNASPLTFNGGEFESLVLPIRIDYYEIEDTINELKAATPATVEDVKQETPDTTPAAPVEDPANNSSTDTTPATDTSKDTPTPAPARIPESVYQAVYKTAVLILTLKKRGYTPTPAAVDFAESYAKNHADTINQMQKARGHIYTSGIELIAAVYTLQNNAA
jgi:hypothetical protein